MRAAITGGGVIGAGWATRRAGTALVDAVLQNARDQGVPAFHVFSASRNTEDILRFYRGHGFEPWGIPMFRSCTDE